MTLRSPTSVLSIAALTVTWCGLWGEFSAANLLTGLVIAVGATVAFGPRPSSGRVRPIPLMKLGGLVAMDLVTSTVGVAIEVLTPKDRTDELLVAVDVGERGRAHLLLLTTAITLTPGTAVVDADAEIGRLTLHLLHKGQKAATIAHVEQLASLADDAFPSRRSSQEPSPSGEPS